MAKPIGRDPIGGGGDETVPPPPFNAVLSIGVSKDGDSLGATLDFSLTGNFTNIGEVQIWRAIGAASLNIAKFLNVPLKTRLPQSFDDRDPALIGNQAFYWIIVENIDFSATRTFGPVDVTISVGVPLPVLTFDWIEASHEALNEATVEVHVACQVVAGVDFKTMKVYVRNYKGSATDRPICSSNTGRSSFHLQQTGELVTLSAVGVNSQGVEQSFGDALVTTLQLSDPLTKPCRVSDIVVIDGAAGTEFRVAANSEPSVIGYRLYRCAHGAGFGAAVLIEQVTKTTEDSYILNDPNHKGLGFDWFITSYNLAGESTNSGPLQRSIAY